MGLSPVRKPTAVVRAAGFTLIEIAVVVSIIGILASTASVQYLAMLERARIARAIVELRAISADLDPMGDEYATLPTSLAEAGADRNDPWGRPYRYLLISGGLPPGIASLGTGLPHVSANNGNDTGAEGGSGGGNPAIALARKDRFLVPINSDFDLYSVGPDGETHATLNNPVSRDDIIRAADGGFYGLAEKF